MKSYCLALAAIAAMGFASAAYAGDATTEAWSATATTPATTAPTGMSDSDMDKVTAGSVSLTTPGAVIHAGGGQGGGGACVTPTHTGIQVGHC